MLTFEQPDPVDGVQGPACNSPDSLKNIKVLTKIFTEMEALKPCSLCKQPYHRRKSCPLNHEMYKQAEGKKSRLIAVAHFKQKFSEKKAKKKEAKKTKLLEE